MRCQICGDHTKRGWLNCRICSEWAKRIFSRHLSFRYAAWRSLVLDSIGVTYNLS